MKLKICGMKYPRNIKEVAALKPDYMGFIFYAKSPRFVTVDEVKESIENLGSGISKVGVFVNHPVADLIETCKALNLDFAQLHGDEMPAEVSEIKSAGIGVFKVFRIDAQFDWDKTIPFDDADFFLFDTATPDFGGSGKHFDWNVLNKYKEKKLFFLSGGIGIEDIAAIKKLKLPNLWGIDTNSRMEVSPGRKDVNRVQILIKELTK